MRIDFHRAKLAAHVAIGDTLVDADGAVVDQVLRTLADGTVEQITLRGYAPRYKRRRALVCKPQDVLAVELDHAEADLVWRLITEAIDGQDNIVATWGGTPDVAAESVPERKAED